MFAKSVFLLAILALSRADDSWLWDEETDPPSEVSNEVPVPEEPPVSNEVPVPEEPPHEATTSKYRPDECPAENEYWWAIPHASDCGKWYMCNWGEKIEMSCPAGLHFNPKLMVCDWPRSAGCSIKENGEGEIQ